MLRSSPAGPAAVLPTDVAPPPTAAPRIATLRNVETAAPETELIVYARLSSPHGRNELRREFAQGRMLRLRAGVYLPTDLWRSASSREQHLWRIRAAAALRPDLVFSHLSAAAVWGLPRIGTWPTAPSIIAAADSYSASPTYLQRHRVVEPFEVVVRDGLLVTTLARTVVDIARTEPLSAAVAMADHALPGNQHKLRDEPDRPLTTHDALRNEWARCSRRGARMAELALRLADGRSGSAGESLSRTAMYLLGMPRPELQTRFADERGHIGSVDFYWPEQRLIGEFDGLGKYRRAELLQGLSPADAVIAEKQREDRLRAPGRGVSRWGWETASSLPRLREHLAKAGLPTGTPRSEWLAEW